MTTIELARRLEHNDAQALVEYVHTLQRLQRTDITLAQPVADGYAVITGRGSPINRAVGLGMHQPIAAADLDLIEQVYAAAGLPSQVDLCPLADRSLLELLRERGYAVHSFYNSHIRSITAADTQLPPVPGVDVAAIEPADAEAWITTDAHGFTGHADLPDDNWSLRLSRASLHRPGAIGWLARIDRVAVGAGAMVVRDGLATLYSTSVLPAYRGRGVQAALVRARLIAAAHAGCDLATVLTTPGSGSGRNMQRAGFEVAYTKPTVIKTLA